MLDSRGLTANLFLNDLGRSGLFRGRRGLPEFQGWNRMPAASFIQGEPLIAAELGEKWQLRGDSSHDRRPIVICRKQQQGSHMLGKSENMPIWELSTATCKGRAEVNDPVIASSFNLGLSEAVAQHIQKIEESVVSAEHRLGYFRVG